MNAYTAALDDPVLQRFRMALNEMYGDRLERVILYGSRARGNFSADSDYDVAVFLKALPDYWAEAFRLADLRLRFLDEDARFFDTKPFRAGQFDDRTPLMAEIRREGIEV